MTYMQIRKVRGSISPREFARLIDVTPSAVYCWERGARRPRGGALTILKMLQRDREKTLRLLYQARRGYAEVR